MPELRFAAPKERRVALITGGARGIGRAAALRIAEESRDIVIADILAEEGARTVADILVCCAGILGLETPFLEQPAEQFSEVMSINIHGIYHAHQAAVPKMLEGEWGRCVSITSGARVGSPNHVPYSVSKAAVYSFVRCLGGAWPKQNVFVNGVEPGRADMVVPRVSEDHLRNPGIPIGRYSDANEVAEVIEFLCSERNTTHPGLFGASRDNRDESDLLQSPWIGCAVGVLELEPGCSAGAFYCGCEDWSRQPPDFGGSAAQNQVSL